MRAKTTAALLACVAMGALNAPPASAEPAPQPQAMLRAAHFSPDTPGVDVYLASFSGSTEKLALSNVGYGDVSDYSALAPGQYTVGMRPHGADPSTPVVFSWTLDAKPGQAFTALAIGMNKTLQGKVLSDDLTAPPAGQSRVRIVQASDTAPRADITADNGPVFGKAVPFTTTTDYSTVPAGTWPVTAVSSSNPAVTTKASETLKAGQANTIVLLDAKGGGLSMKVLDDAVGVNIPPLGPVQAGGGSTAVTTSWMRSGALGMTAVALLATMVLLGTVMRSSRAR
jgi:uncharacterized protein DUF4397